MRRKSCPLGLLLIPSLLVLASLPARAMVAIQVSVENRSAITASNEGAAIGASNGNFDSGSGRVGIASGLVGALSKLEFSAPGERASGEVGLQWGIEADHCLAAGGCGGVDHFVDATADLVLVIEVDAAIESWELSVGVQSFGNINGVVDGGTLPACTSVMSAPILDISVTGAATAVVDFRSATELSVSDADDCIQDGHWFKDEEAGITVSGTGAGIFELHIRQEASVSSIRQTGFFAIPNGSDTCFRAGADPGDGIAFYDACDYPGLVDAEGNRDGDGLLGNEPEDGGVWISDRVTGTAIEVTGLKLQSIPTLSPAALALLATAFISSGLWMLCGRERISRVV
jgi:hypothetical protein